MQCHFDEVVLAPDGADSLQRPLPSALWAFLWVFSRRGPEDGSVIVHGCTVSHIGHVITSSLSEQLTHRLVQ
jgi:hypothetical protein